jgi:hypothetical protein
MMKKKQNCWEFKNCGRGPDSDGDSCPAATDKRLDGVHGGKEGGRVCWVIAGTYCGGKPQGYFAQKFTDCSLCDFYNLVRDEEGRKFEPATSLIRMLLDATDPEGSEGSED